MVLAHVVTTGEISAEIEANVESAKKNIESIKKELSAAGINVEEHVRVGNPIDEISSIAEEEDVSVIALSISWKKLDEGIGLRRYCIRSCQEVYKTSLARESRIIKKEK